MITENLSTLKIHKLTKEQYDRELENGRIDENALYLTPDEAESLRVGKNVTGEVFLVDLDGNGLAGEEATAQEGAEIFNRYGELKNKAVGRYSHAEGYATTAVGSYSHAEGNAAKAMGSASHAEGLNTTASGSASHAEGNGNVASGSASHAEGNGNVASGSASHAEGMETVASGDYSHAEGYFTTAFGISSHAEGIETIASGDYQHVQGKFNIADNNYAHIVGNGAGLGSRSNAHTIDWDGNAWFAGEIKIGGTRYNDSAAKTLATKEDLADLSFGASIATVSEVKAFLSI